MTGIVTRVSKEDLDKGFWVRFLEIISSALFESFFKKAEQETEQLNESAEAFEKVSTHFQNSAPKSKTKKEILNETKDKVK